MNNQASCLCGSVRWEITAEPFYAFNCHCKLCRKAHSSAFGTYRFVKTEQFNWLSDTDTIRHYRSSHLLTRSFCGTCGSVVSYPSEQSQQFVAPAGCHDDGKKSDCDIFVAHRAPWYDITGDLPRHDDYPEYTGFERVEEEPLEPAPEGIVRGSCMCGTVKFEINEPFKTVPDAEFFTQVFCKICGSKMPRLDPGRGFAVIPFGALDDDHKAKPVDHLFTDYKAKWHEITGDLPVFKETLA